MIATSIKQVCEVINNSLTGWLAPSIWSYGPLPCPAPPPPWIFLLFTDVFILLWMHFTSLNWNTIILISNASSPHDTSVCCTDATVLQRAHCCLYDCRTPSQVPKIHSCLYFSSDENPLRPQNCIIFAKETFFIQFVIKCSHEIYIYDVRKSGFPKHFSSVLESNFPNSTQLVWGFWNPLNRFQF